MVPASHDRHARREPNKTASAHTLRYEGTPLCVTRAIVVDGARFLLLLTLRCVLAYQLLRNALRTNLAPHHLHFAVLATAKQHAYQPQEWLGTAGFVAIG
jgi:hypothetical protein